MVGTSVGLLVGQFTHRRNSCAETRILDVQKERKQRGKDPRPGTQEVLPKCWLLSQGFLMRPPWRHQDARPPVPSAGSELPATSTRAPQLLQQLSAEPPDSSLGAPELLHQEEEEKAQDPLHSGS